MKPSKAKQLKTKMRQCPKQQINMKVRFLLGYAQDVVRTWLSVMAKTVRLSAAAGSPNAGLRPIYKAITDQQVNLFSPFRMG